MADGTPRAGWTFLTNHTHVLICLVRKPDSRIREVADHVGITERMVQKILNELVEGRVISRVRSGRCNIYQVHLEAQLRHPVEMNHTVGELLDRIAM